MPHPIAYLNFNGNCEEAMRFYERVLDGKLDKLIRAADSPWADEMPAEQGDMVIHARLVLDGNGLLYGGDCPAAIPYEGIKGVSLTLNYDSVEEAQRVFDSLAEGGTVTMAMQPSFWAKNWGMLVDRFGTSWIVNGEMLPY